MLIPEAEPVIPASTVTLIASFNSGLGMAARALTAPGNPAGGDNRAEAILRGGVHRRENNRPPPSDFPPPAGRGYCDSRKPAPAQCRRAAPPAPPRWR